MSKIKYNVDLLSAKKYPLRSLGTKPKLLRSSLDKTSLQPILKDMYLLVREMIHYMSKFDRPGLGFKLYNVILDAEKHFAMSYYWINNDEVKLSEAYDLLCSLEEIKFLTDICFESDILNLDDKKKDGLRNKVYITVAEIQEQADKWYQWIQSLVQQNDSSK